jgi:hypothetical protein
MVIIRGVVAAIRVRVEVERLPEKERAVQQLKKQFQRVLSRKL